MILANTKTLQRLEHNEYIYYRGGLSDTVHVQTCYVHIRTHARTHARTYACIHTHIRTHAQCHCLLVLCISANIVTHIEINSVVLELKTQ